MHPKGSALVPRGVRLHYTISIDEAMIRLSPDSDTISSLVSDRIISIL